MANIESLFGKTIEEIERMLNTKTVVGEPLNIEGNTLIPLISVGFGFGAGEGTESGKGGGGGTGGGGGVKPVALIVVNKDGVTVEAIKTSMGSAMERIAETVSKAAVSAKASGD